MKIAAEQLREEGAFGLTGWTGQTLGMTTAHRHVDLEINYVLSGSMTYLIGGQIVRLPLQRLCLLWGGIPHQMLRGNGVTEAIWVTVPLTTVLRWRLPDEMVRPLLTTGFLADPTPRAGDRDLLHQWVIDLPRTVRRRGTETSPRKAERTVGQHDAATTIALLEIEARLRRLALEVAVQQKISPGNGTEEGVGLYSVLPSSAAMGEPADRGLVSVEAMAQFITQNFRSALDIAHIAAEAHLHPHYAVTLFRRHTGMTLSQYLTLQRVAHAQRLLVTTDDAITSIALDSGFGSISRFYEAFRQETGNTPRAFRLQSVKPFDRADAP